jgi:hypothetical protein
MAETKKYLLRLIRHYSERCLAEERAGDRTDMTAVKRHYSEAKKAWDEIGVELDKRLTAENDLARALVLLEMVTASARDGTDLPEAWADEVDLLRERHASPGPESLEVDCAAPCAVESLE